MKDGRPAVVLLSGGLDSATAAAVACERGFVVFPLAVQYGQRHVVELKSAAAVAQNLQLQPLKIVSVDLRAIGGSALTAEMEVPKGAMPERLRATGEPPIPVTYVPARNTIFLSLALAYAETLGATDLVIGANALDYSGYPDCRGPYLRAFASLAALATRAGVEQGRKFTIHAPLLQMTKAGIITEAVRLRVPLALTHSCYDPAPDGAACGRCESCRLRRRGFAEAGVADPTRYI